MNRVELKRMAYLDPAPYGRKPYSWRPLTREDYEWENKVRFTELPPTPPGTMRYQNRNGKKVLMDVTTGTPATLKEGMQVIVKDLPYRFCRAWKLRTEKMYNAMIENVGGRRCFVLVTGAYDNEVVIPVRQMSGKAELLLGETTTAIMH